MTAQPLTTEPAPGPTAPAPHAEDALRALVARLTPARKVQLLTGSTAWRLHALEEIGLRTVTLSDGPAGVRGTGEDPAETSVLLPAPSALAATWDTGLAARTGTLFAGEARRHGVDLVLAPQVNIQRTPVAGRHFECYSEDPFLTSAISGSLVGAMQDAGVAACLKHFVANDSETDRTQYLSVVDERTLREVYLAPFEHAVHDVGVWSVMAAYNQVDDGVLAAPATEHDHLLRTVLKEEWGFDGVVVSDWLAAQRTVESANGGLDLVMPGPGGPWEDALLSALESGDVDQAVVDDKVLRLLRLALRVGALPEMAPGVPAPAVDATLPRELAARATVVLRDEDARLPFARSAVRRVALLGPNAVAPYVQGGGSAHVHPDRVVGPAEGLRSALPDAEVVVLRGGDNRRYAPALDLARCTDPRTGAPGIRVSLVDEQGREIAGDVHPAWDGWWRDLPDAVHDVRLEAVVTLPEPGLHHLELGTVGRWAFEVDGRPVGQGTRTVGAEVVLDSSINQPPGCTAEVDGARRVHLSATVQSVRNEGYGNQARAALRHRLPGEDASVEIAAAVLAAQAADLVVVVVGTTEEVESEGWDRDSLALPGRQDELVEAVLEAAPDAVVVVNAGAPVLLPWLDRARTVLWTWLPGQDGGHALADVLLGAVEPGGRLPWTLPASADDAPVPHALPQDGVVHYSEGVHVGYREWERRQAVPAAPFGHGLGWTTWRYDGLAAGPEVTADGAVELSVRVTNTGPRAGREVVQVYLEPPADAGRPTDADPERPAALPDRPVRWLAGFAVVAADAGEQVTASVRVPARALQVWDVAAGRWTTPPGTYRLRIGRSIRDLRLDDDVTVPSADQEEVPLP